MKIYQLYSSISVHNFILSYSQLYVADGWLYVKRMEEQSEQCEDEGKEVR